MRNQQIIFRKLFPEFRQSLHNPDSGGGQGLRACRVVSTEKRGNGGLSRGFQGEAHGKGKPCRILHTETHQDVQGKPLWSGEGSAPVLRKREETRGKYIGGGSTRRTGKQIHKKIKAIPPRPSLINADERGEGGPSGEFCGSGSEAVQNNTFPGFCSEGLFVAYKPRYTIF
jgi:hypothetical protein